MFCISVHLISGLAWLCSSLLLRLLTPCPAGPARLEQGFVLRNGYPGTLFLFHSCVEDLMRKGQGLARQGIWDGSMGRADYS